jgi:hypothetical protein
MLEAVKVHLLPTGQCAHRRIAKRLGPFQEQHNENALVYVRAREGSLHMQDPLRVLRLVFNPIFLKSDIGSGHRSKDLPT